MQPPEMILAVFLDTPLCMSPCGHLEMLDLQMAELVPRGDPKMTGIHIWTLSLKAKSHVYYVFFFFFDPLEWDVITGLLSM